MPDEDPGNDSAGYARGVRAAPLSEQTEGSIGVLILIIVLVGVGVGGYTGLDSAGWIPHSEDTVITAQANWFVGESKNCMSAPLNAQAARTLNKAAGYAISQVSCDDGPEHNVKITFYGRVEQPEYEWVQWRCTRNEDSFTCRQTGNSEPTLTGKDNETGRPIVSHDRGKTWQWADK